MRVLKELNYDELRFFCDESIFKFKDTREVAPSREIIGQGKTGKAFISDYNLIPTINHKDTKAYSVYKLSDYNEELGQQAEKKFCLKK